MTNSASLNPLLCRFLVEEATAHVRSLLSASVAEAAANSTIAARVFEFNLFEVKLNFTEGSATVIDVLAPSSETTLALPEFLRALAA